MDAGSHQSSGVSPVLMRQGGLYLGLNKSNQPTSQHALAKKVGAFFICAVGTGILVFGLASGASKLTHLLQKPIRILDTLTLHTKEWGMIGMPVGLITISVGVVWMLYMRKSVGVEGETRSRALHDMRGVANWDSRSAIDNDL